MNREGNSNIKSEFWAGGHHEFHREARKRNMGKGTLGWFNKVVRKINDFLFILITREIDHRLFGKKAKNR